MWIFRYFHDFCPQTFGVYSTEELALDAKNRYIRKVEEYRASQGWPDESERRSEFLDRLVLEEFEADTDYFPEHLREGYRHAD